MPVAAAAANALKKRNKSSKKKEEATFPTPARYGWGQVRRVQASFHLSTSSSYFSPSQVAPLINPRMAQVQKIFMTSGMIFIL